MKTKAMLRTITHGIGLAVAVAFAASGASARIITPLASEVWLTAAAAPVVPLDPLPLAPLEPPSVAPPDPPPVAPPPLQPQNKPTVPSPVPPGAKESTRPLPKPAPAESRTPEEASLRAADPRDPSGALIVKPPLGHDTPPKPR